MADDNTITTSDFLDLIQADTASPNPINNANSSKNNTISDDKKYNSDNESGRYSTVSGWRDRTRESNLFRVRLTQSPQERRRPALEEEEIRPNEVGMHHRQKMPLNGGYGGMFDTGVGQLKKNRSNNDLDEEETIGSEKNGSTLSTAFSLASKLFSAGGSAVSTQSKPNIRGGARRGSRPPSELFASLPGWCINFSIHWLRLPFQLRYFVQLFSIAGVFLLASLNYFIVVDDGASRSFALKEGGGASPDKIPSMHMKKPLQYLHSDIHGNTLLEKAKDKLQQSTRIGDGSGPFTYGWKSMPRQIFNDFDTGLDDKGRTIENPKSSKGAIDVKVFPSKGTVAYVLPVVTCYNPIENTDADNVIQNFYPDAPNHPIDEDSFRDFAVMLRAMVHAHSYQNPASGSFYDYKMHALIHPNAKSCTDKKGNTADRSLVLQNLGYEVSIQRPSIKVDNIKSEYLQNYFLEHGGGEDMSHLSDLIRLSAYELEAYDAVVLVDYDTLILGSVDEAIDLINDSSKGEGDSVDAVFSWKHVPSFGRPQFRASVVNLSFFILKPSKDVFNKMRRSIKESPFSEVRGWGTIGRGRFPGWMTTAGFLTYYYDEVDNGSKVEMNRCSFGNTGMGSAPIELLTNAGKVDCESEQGQWTNQCQDCSKSDTEDILVADLSYCIAPWKCSYANAADALSYSLCRKFQKQWAGARLQMEDAHPQLQKSSGNICVGGEYQPMKMQNH
jgi:hypothetical protein